MSDNMVTSPDTSMTNNIRVEWTLHIAQGASPLRTLPVLFLTKNIEMLSDDQLHIVRDYQPVEHLGDGTTIKLDVGEGATLNDMEDILQEFADDCDHNKVTEALTDLHDCLHELDPSKTTMTNIHNRLCFINDTLKHNDHPFLANTTDISFADIAWYAAIRANPLAWRLAKEDNQYLGAWFRFIERNNLWMTDYFALVGAQTDEEYELPVETAAGWKRWISFEQLGERRAWMLMRPGLIGQRMLRYWDMRSAREHREEENRARANHWRDDWTRSPPYPTPYPSPPPTPPHGSGVPFGGHMFPTPPSGFGVPFGRYMFSTPSPGYVAPWGGHIHMFSTPFPGFGFPFGAHMFSTPPVTLFP